MNNKQLFLGVILSLALFSSCEHSVERTYILDNQSDHTLALDFFSIYYKDKSVTQVRNVTLNPGKSWELEFSQAKRTGIGVFEVFEADSISIVFDNVKFQSYAYVEDVDRNILSNESYLIEDNGDTYRYVFTKEDYENAEPIGEGG